ncbi:hypothetical protein ACKWTF_013269 [Chironomus riparius]
MKYSEIPPHLKVFHTKKKFVPPLFKSLATPLISLFKTNIFTIRMLEFLINILVLYLYQIIISRVKIFITFNEPSVFCDHGHNYAEHAPHIWTYDSVGGILCSHHVLLSHARAYRLYQEKYLAAQNGKVGICLNTGFSYRGNGSVPQDTVERAIQFYFGRYTNPIFSETGDYPQVMRDAIDQKSKQQGRSFSRLPTFTAEEVQMLKGSADFLALNYYSSGMVYPISFDPTIDPVHHDSEVAGFSDPDWKVARSSWLYQVPQGLYDLLNWIRTKYNNPDVYISENGWSDAPLTIEDHDRIEYMRLHLAAISKAITDGCNVLGITVWSLVDNFGEFFLIYNKDSP